MALPRSAPPLGHHVCKTCRAGLGIVASTSVQPGRQYGGEDPDDEPPVLARDADIPWRERIFDELQQIRRTRVDQATRNLYSPYTRFMQRLERVLETASRWGISAAALLAITISLKNLVQSFYSSLAKREYARAAGQAVFSVLVCGAVDITTFALDCMNSTRPVGSNEFFRQSPIAAQLYDTVLDILSLLCRDASPEIDYDLLTISAYQLKQATVGLLFLDFLTQLHRKQSSAIIAAILASLAKIIAIGGQTGQRAQSLYSDVQSVGEHLKTVYHRLQR